MKGKLRPGSFFPAVALFLLLLLAGCATPPSQPTAVGLNPAELAHWQLEGKLGFRSPSKNGSAWINWQQAGDIYQLQLTGPFGAGATRIDGGPDIATLKQSGKPDLTAANGEELTIRLFGWPFPVAQMKDWIKGVTAPTPLPEATDWQDGKLARLVQLGWNIEYSDYQTFNGWLLPGRIKGTREETSFILVIKSWSPEAR